jgi:D-alanine-D-alanine ligase
MAMDKIITKQLLLHHGLPTPGFDYVKPGETAAELLALQQRLPVVVKPSAEGSTVGVHRCANPGRAGNRYGWPATLNGTVMVEDYIAGDELTVSVVNDEVLPIIQIVAAGGILRLPGQIRQWHHPLSGACSPHRCN